MVGQQKKATRSLPPSGPRFIAKPDPSSTLPEVNAMAYATAQEETSWRDVSGLSLEAENYQGMAMALDSKSAQLKIEVR